MEDKQKRQFWGSILMTVAEAVGGSLQGMDKNKKGYIIGVILVAVGVAVGTLLLSSCGAEFLHTAIEGNDGCEPEEIACNESILVICDADKSWNEISECKDWTDGRACCTSNGKVGCHKVEDCQ